MAPAIEAQLQRNQRNFKLGLDSTRVPATSMRLFIYGDPFAGKSAHISTMRSMYSTRKRDKFMRALYARNRGIEVQAIKKEGIRVSLWDMAGQQEFHAFHGYMFPDIGTSSYQLPSMFMFVWSPIDSKSSEKGALKTEKNFEASFRYWLKFLASKRKQSNIALTVMVVFTRADQMVSGSIAPLLDSLRSDFKGVINILDPPFHVDARKKGSVKPVAEHIFLIAKDMLQGNFPNMLKNDSGNIIYINGIRIIVLDPNWFYNEFMGSLIYFSNSKTSESAMPLNDGCTPRDSLEKCLESIVGSKVKGSLLVDLMEAMNLCCKVAINNGVPNSRGDYIFIPTVFTNGGVEKLQWRSSTKLNVDDDTFVYMGRRLECEDKDHTFLTPGLFPRVHVLFNKAFQILEEEYKPNVMLGKDFISICFPNKEIIVMFYQAKSEHVIDVLVRAKNPHKSQHHTPTTLVNMELKCNINTLVMICAQPAGIQGVKLIESVIQLDSLHSPSMVQNREDQCVKITYLKENLRSKLLRGKPESYQWKSARQTLHPLQNNFIDLLGFENYEEVLVSCQAWLKKTTENLYSENDEIDVCREQPNQQNMTIKRFENSLFEHLEDQILEEATDVEVRSINVMAKGISTLYHAMDVNHKELVGKIDAIRHEFQSMRKDVITKVEKSTCKLLKLAMENKVEKQLLCVVVITTNGHEKNVPSLVTSLLGALPVQIHLYCEHATLPHPVENQLGILLTSCSESRAESLHKVLPYITFFFYVLTTVVRLGIKSMGPPRRPCIPNWTPHLKLAKEHPMPSSIIKSKFDRSNSSKTAHVCPSTSEYFKEWQTCLAFILEEYGGVTDQNIAEKFCLWRAKIDGGRVAWLCKKHYDEQRPTWLS